MKTKTSIEKQSAGSGADQQRLFTFKFRINRPYSLVHGTYVKVVAESLKDAKKKLHCMNPAVEFIPVY